MATNEITTLCSNIVGLEQRAVEERECAQRHESQRADHENEIMTLGSNIVGLEQSTWRWRLGARIAASRGG